MSFSEWRRRSKCVDEKWKREVTTKPSSCLNIPAAAGAVQGHPSRGRPTPSLHQLHLQHISPHLSFQMSSCPFSKHSTFICSSIPLFTPSTPHLYHPSLSTILTYTITNYISSTFASPSPASPPTTSQPLLLDHLPYCIILYLYASPARASPSPSSLTAYLLPHLLPICLDQSLNRTLPTPPSSCLPACLPPPEHLPSPPLLVPTRSFTAIRTSPLGVEVSWDSEKGDQVKKVMEMCDVRAKVSRLFGSR